MSTRFSNLEFEPPHEEPARADETLAAVDSLGATHIIRARRAEEWGRWEEALRYFTRALGEERGLVSAWVGQVRMLVELDECHEARIWSEKSLQLFRGQGELLAAQAQAAARLNDLKAAQKLSDASLAAGDDSPWRWVARGEVLVARGQRFAEECFEKVVQHRAADWLDSVRVGRIWGYYGRPANAVAHMKAAIRQRPDHAYPWFALGECQARLAFAPAARESFERAVDLAPRWTAPQRALDALDAGSGVGAWLRRWIPWRRR